MKPPWRQERGGPVLRSILCLCLAAGAGCRQQGGRPRVTIRATTWTVELATTAEERYRGLSGRDEIHDGTGMLFIYPSAQPRSYCMRGCRVPLDIAFIGSDGCVINTYTMAVEPVRAGRTSYPSSVPAQYALEVSAGALHRAGVRSGDKVAFSAEVPSASKADPGP